MELIPMGITNHKKETMQVVKCYIIIIFVFLYQSSIAQGLQGTYHGNDGITYQFSDSTFKTVTPLHFVEKEVAKGSYKINEDTLFINFKPIKNHPKAGFKFIKKEPIYNIVKGDSLSQDSTIYVHFKIVDDNNKAIVPPPIVQLRNKKNQVIQGFSADSLGHIAEIFIFGPFKGYFYFTSLANEELKIEADTLTGYKSTARVTLPKRVKYKSCDCTKKFLIEDWQKDKIVLRRLEDGNRLVLVRKERK